MLKADTNAHGLSNTYVILLTEMVLCLPIDERFEISTEEFIYPPLFEESDSPIKCNMCYQIKLTNLFRMIKDITLVEK